MGAWHVSAAIQRACNLTEENLKNAERDLHSLFRRYELAIPVNLSCMRFGLLYLHYISLETWFRFLLADYPHLLLGGFNTGDPRSGVLLESFWEAYRVAHGDHFVFREHPRDLKRCVPFYWHLDEGTGLRKSAVLVFNMQTAFGSETASLFEKKFTDGSGRSDAEIKQYMLESQFHNQRGSSLLSRFLYTIIPKRWYTKKIDFVYDKVLDRLATETARLACEGVRGMYPICLGVKGDAPALAKAAHYFRSFMTLELCHYLYPIGSMYAIYGNIYHQYIPPMLYSIYTIHGSYGYLWLYNLFIWDFSRVSYLILRVTFSHTKQNKWGTYQKELERVSAQSAWRDWMICPMKTSIVVPGGKRQRAWKTHGPMKTHPHCWKFLVRLPANRLSFGKIHFTFSSKLSVAIGWPVALSYFWTLDTGLWLGAQTRLTFYCRMPTKISTILWKRSGMEATLQTSRISPKLCSTGQRSNLIPMEGSRGLIACWWFAGWPLLFNVVVFSRNRTNDRMSVWSPTP